MLRVEFKRLARGSIVYGIGGILQRFLSLLLLPFFTRVLTPEDYGIVALIALVTTGLTGLFNLGTGNSLGILYFSEADQENRPPIIWTNVMVLLANSTLLMIILFIFAPQLSRVIFQSPEYGSFFRIAFISLALVTIMDPFYAYLRMEEKASHYVLLTLINSIATILISVMFVLVLRWGVSGLLLASLFGQVISLGIVAITVAKKIPFGFNRSLVAPLVRVGFPSIFGLFAFLVVDYADRQMVQRMMGLDPLGVYSIGYSFGMVMMVFVGAFSSAWPPFFASFINRREDAKLIFGKVLHYYIIGFGMLTMIFFAAAKPVVSILVAPVLIQSFTVVGLVASAYMLKGCYLILLPGIYFSKKMYWQSLIEWSAAFINIGLNLYWIPQYGIKGAAGATLVSYLVLPLLTWAIGRHYLAVKYDWIKIGLSAVGFFITGILLFQIAQETPWTTSLILSLFTLFVLSVFLFYGVLETRERALAVEKARLFLNLEKKR